MRGVYVFDAHVLEQVAAGLHAFGRAELALVGRRRALLGEESFGGLVAGHRGLLELAEVELFDARLELADLLVGLDQSTGLEDVLDDLQAGLLVRRRGVDPVFEPRQEVLLDDLLEDLERFVHRGCLW